MEFPSRAELLVYMLCAAAITFVGVRALRSGGVEGGEVVAPRAAAGREPTGSARGGAVVARAPTGTLTVHVAGAVRRPGVYRFGEGRRVTDAVRRAGGPGARADLQSLNLAAKLADGQQVLVPARARPGVALAGAGGGSGGAGAASSPPVSLSSATAEQLDGLDGVGPATAKKILEYRSAHGGFRSLDQLGEVPGIGPKKLAGLKAALQP